MAQKPSSNTMEINSILEEARSRNQALNNPQKTSPRKSESAGRYAAPSPAKTVKKNRSDTDYVDISRASYSRSAEEPRESAQKKEKSKKPLVITIVVILVLLLAGGGFTWYLYQNSGSSTIVSDNVYVNDVAIGGMTMADAEQEMKGIEQKLADSIKVHINADAKQYDLTKDDFSYSFNTEEILNQVREHSESKGFGKEEKRYEIDINVDTSNAGEIAEKIGKENHSDPVNASVKKFDPSADKMFTFNKEVNGKDVDTKDLEAKIKGVFKDKKTSGSIAATVKTVKPKITAAYLDENIKKLSDFSTTSTNNSNGNENMRISLKACNGSVIDPGETWSFNDCTGDSNDPDNGYLPAGVIVQGRSETGVGGGICQSSTTIYNAAILCGMEVVERACHYYQSVYVDAGRDATIDYGNIDLKLKNVFDYPLFMKCWMEDAELYCEMYGLPNPEFDEIEISTSDPDYFSNGYTVKAWRTYKLDGKKVKEDDLPTSTYYTSAPSSGSDSSSSEDDDDDDDDDSDSSAASSSAAESSGSSAADNDTSSSGGGGDADTSDGGEDNSSASTEE